MNTTASTPNQHQPNEPAVIRAESGYWPLQLLLGWINLTLTAPVVYLYIGLPLVLRQHGWSGTDIGLLQLAGLPAILKFLLAAPVDRYPLGRAGYRNWSIVLSVVYAALLLFFSRTSLQESPWSFLFTLALSINLLGTWTDVPINALAIRYLPESQRMRAGAIRSAATSLGAIVGGGLMLLLYTRFGWAAPFQVMALALLSGCVLLAFMQRKPLPGVSSEPVQTGINWRLWKAYFTIAGHGKWAILMLFYFPFVGSAWVYMKPLLLDSGLSTERIAMIVGILGGVLAALASLVVARMTKHYGIGQMLSGVAWLNVLALAMLLMFVLAGASATILIAMAILLAIAVGAASGLVFGVMMYFVRPALVALDYGIQSSLFILTRTLMPAVAGVLMDRTGYAGMMGFLVSGALIIAWATISWHQSLTAAMTASSRK
ncbi:MAG: MFS transporter [Advenella sp.]|uniref:MFS transporter n=1 Tax=Advenella kashmirensis TaxID=310575 RepID=A0A356LBH6_9BURK|nr:MFS transporter [Advenella sp. FME57]HBP28169.1 MFS transporter [Advenella kashmirensis]